MAGITFNAGYLAENFPRRPEGHSRHARCAPRARSLGTAAEFQAWRLVVVPQLLRVVFPQLTNQMVWAILMTSLGVERWG